MVEKYPPVSDARPFCSVKRETLMGPMRDGIMRGVGYTLGAVGAIAVVLLLVLAMFKAKIIGLDDGLDDNPYAEEDEALARVLARRVEPVEPVVVERRANPVTPDDARIYGGEDMI